MISCKMMYTGNLAHRHEGRSDGRQCMVYLDDSSTVATLSTVVLRRLGVATIMW